MTSRERLEALEKWLYENACRGKQLKAPAEDGDITKATYQEPRVFVGFMPQRADETGFYVDSDPLNVAPGILLMPGLMQAKNQEEKRFDTYRNVHRPKALGQSEAYSILLVVYEPGVRLPGFQEAAEKGEGYTKYLAEGTREGLFTLLDWKDEIIRKILGAKGIPESDLITDEENIQFTPYTEGGYIADKRPYYMGILDVVFYGYADEGRTRAVEGLLL